MLSNKRNKDSNDKKKSTNNKNKNIIDKINAWQDFGYVRPLVCKRTGKRLQPSINKRTGRVCLYCPESNFVQIKIPNIVLQSRLVVFEHAKAENKKKYKVSVEDSSRKG